jgi:prepilin-type N-terminal cleavage/methylation domain-containing protein
MTRRQGDGGYTLIELLLVIVVLGILATIVVAAAGGFTAEAEQRTCEADAYLLRTATEAYFAQRGGTVIPPLNGSQDGVELRLADEGFLRGPSEHYDLTSTGQLQLASGSPCSV